MRPKTGNVSEESRTQEENSIVNILHISCPLKEFLADTELQDASTSLPDCRAGYSNMNVLMIVSKWIQEHKII